jgi:ADP-heptose:LPS heptosyltransferase
MVENEQTPSLVEEKPTIVVKLPFDLQERLLAFPFLHLLNEHNPNAEIHLITPKKDIEVLNLLPFKAFYHEFDEDEIETIFDVHRFAVNAKIYKVDLFISLTNAFVDACLGVALGAKKRLGFSDGWKTLVFNQKTLRPKNHHLCEDFFSLLKVNLGGEIDTKLKVMSRDLPPIIEEWDTLPYIAVNLSPIRNAVIEEEWVELISQFENQRFVFFASEEQTKVEFLMKTFLERLPKNNTYIPFILKNWIEIAKMTSFARGVMTYNGPAATLAAYTGTKTLVIFDREDPQRSGPFYYLGEYLIINAQQSNVSSSLKPRASFDVGEVVDKAHSFFRL